MLVNQACAHNRNSPLSQYIPFNIHIIWQQSQNKHNLINSISSQYCVKCHISFSSAHSLNFWLQLYVDYIRAICCIQSSATDDF